MRTKKLKILSKKKLLELKPYLDKIVNKVELETYIDADPVQFMHAFQKKNDQEIAGFFAAIMAWGRRDIVISKVNDLLERMDYKPEEFTGNFSESDSAKLEGFKHRTFKPIDIYWMIKSIQSILLTHGTFEGFWEYCQSIAMSQQRELIAIFHEQFFSFHPDVHQRTKKHISNPEKNSSCKRLYMYLRWCIRKSNVDLGTMNFITPSELKIPLDVHVARQARKLGLLSRHQNDWKSVLELNEKLCVLDPSDPAKYDFALFGLGIDPNLLDKSFVVNSL